MSALVFITLPVFDDLASPRRFMQEKQTWSSDRFSGQSGLGIIWHEQHWVLGPSLHTEKWYFHLYTFTEENPSWRGKDYKWWGLYTIQCIGGCVYQKRDIIFSLNWCWMWLHVSHIDEYWTVNSLERKALVSPRRWLVRPSWDLSRGINRCWTWWCGSWRQELGGEKKAIVSPRCWGRHKRDGGHEYHAFSPGGDIGNEDEEEHHALGSTRANLSRHILGGTRWRYGY